MNIGAGASTQANGSDNVYDYLHGEKPDFRWGVKGVFAVIATYEDINGNPYYTLTLFNSFERSGERYPIVKRTKTGDYSSGYTEKLNIMDWVA